MRLNFNKILTTIILIFFESDEERKECRDDTSSNNKNKLMLIKLHKIHSIGIIIQTSAVNFIFAIFIFINLAIEIWIFKIDPIPSPIGVRFGFIFCLQFCF